MNKKTIIEKGNEWGLSYFVEISLWGMYSGAQLVERD